MTFVVKKQGIYSDLYNQVPKGQTCFHCKDNIVSEPYSRYITIGFNIDGAMFTEPLYFHISCFTTLAGTEYSEAAFKQAEDYINEEIKKEREALARKK